MIHIDASNASCISLTRVIRGEPERNIVGRGAADAHGVTADRILEVVGRTSGHTNDIKVVLM